ncbi:hypothetical protein ABZW18_25935 [Streptomyces sp. NPDC004647]|uniref:hypothetical protein n=1 Tax=Streptomyces sp. NPDC004647 TaxID=3154671 RepID=UPI0033A84AFE
MSGVRVVALRVRRGDLVCDKGRWREVKNVRSSRFAAGGPIVVLIFKSGPALRVHAADVLSVDRGGQRAVREVR